MRGTSLQVAAATEEMGGVRACVCVCGGGGGVGAGRQRSIAHGHCYVTRLMPDHHMGSGPSSVLLLLGDIFSVHQQQCARAGGHHGVQQGGGAVLLGFLLKSSSIADYSRSK